MSGKLGMVGAVIAMAAAVAFGWPAHGSGRPAACEGAWYVDTVGAPFTPHLFAFDPDGLLHVTFPDAAERDNSAGMGVGVWESSGKRCSGRFIENNADRLTNAFTTNLIVKFSITVFGRGNRFEGTATAGYYDRDGVLINGPFAAELLGQRITMDSRPPVVAD
jgi:hypothetical protein